MKLDHRTFNKVLAWACAQVDDAGKEERAKAKKAEKMPRGDVRAFAEAQKVRIGPGSGLRSGLLSGLRSVFLRSGLVWCLFRALAL